MLDGKVVDWGSRSMTVWSRQESITRVVDGSDEVIWSGRTLVGAAPGLLEQTQQLEMDISYTSTSSRSQHAHTAPRRYLPPVEMMGFTRPGTSPEMAYPAISPDSAIVSIPVTGPAGQDGTIKWGSDLRDAWHLRSRVRRTHRSRRLHARLPAERTSGTSRAWDWSRKARGYRDRCHPRPRAAEMTWEEPPRGRGGPAWMTPAWVPAWRLTRTDVVLMPQTPMPTPMPVDGCRRRCGRGRHRHGRVITASRIRPSCRYEATAFGTLIVNPAGVG